MYKKDRSVLTMRERQEFKARKEAMLRSSVHAARQAGNAAASEFEAEALEMRRVVEAHTKSRQGMGQAVAPRLPA